MSSPYVRKFTEPDDVIEKEHFRSDILDLAGISVARTVHSPSFRWSLHVKPSVGTEWCEARHVGIVVRGAMRVLLASGVEFDCRTGDVYEIPPQHDAWIVGGEECETIDWTGTRSWIPAYDALTRRVLATLVFTDIVDSTQIAARLGDTSWSDLIGVHDARGRDAVERFGGRLVKTTGDGVLAIFDGPARAIRCAFTLRDVAKELGLTIRSGIHTGEVELIGDDVAGLAVHEASRVADTAGVDQILVSAITRSLSTDETLGFTDGETYDLKGIGSRELFSVVARNP